MNKEFAEKLTDELTHIYDVGEYVGSGYEAYFIETSEESLASTIKKLADKIQKEALQELADQAQELNMGYEE